MEAIWLEQGASCERHAPLLERLHLMFERDLPATMQGMGMAGGGARRAARSRLPIGLMRLRWLLRACRSLGSGRTMSSRCFLESDSRDVG